MIAKQRVVVVAAHGGAMFTLQLTDTAQPLQIASVSPHQHPLKSTSLPYSYQCTTVEQAWSIVRQFKKTSAPKWEDLNVRNNDRNMLLDVIIKTT